jgi:glutathione synthase/RimK-type ligase-like ATP-grasp enzyme
LAALAAHGGKILYLNKGEPMPKIGIIYGMENTFPNALVERINSKNVRGVTAEHIRIGGIKMAEPSGYNVIVDRISHDIDFYRAYLKNAMLNGTVVINNPFWWSADDKFFNYALASKLGVAVPNTVVLPHKSHPPGTTVQSMRNLAFPLNWEEVFTYIGFPAFLKPFSGGGWKHVYKVHSPEEFFKAYDQTGSMCMTLQSAVEFDDYYRCYVVGQEKVRVMKYDPKQPHHLRYVKDGASESKALQERLAKDSLTLCKALGYDFNTTELAVQDGVPYAIDFLNPAPDADVHSVGQANFDWVVENMAQLAIDKAVSKQPKVEYRWTYFLNAGSAKRSAASS